MASANPSYPLLPTVWIAVALTARLSREQLVESAGTLELGSLLVAFKYRDHRV